MTLPTVAEVREELRLVGTGVPAQGRANALLDRIPPDAVLVTPESLARAMTGIVYMDTESNRRVAALIVAAVNALPALLDVAEAARDTVDDLDGIYSLRAALDRLEATDA